VAFSATAAALLSTMAPALFYLRPSMGSYLRRLTSRDGGNAKGLPGAILALPSSRREKEWLRYLNVVFNPSISSSRPDVHTTTLNLYRVLQWTGIRNAYLAEFSTPYIILI